MNEQQQLAKAIHLAAEVHLCQFDKGGRPYILHPLYVMNKLLFDSQLATIGVLHDVIEDSHDSVKLVDLESMGFSQRVISAVDLLTHRKGDDYLADYIPRICTNYDAVRVKRKDLEHNSDITRLKGISSKDFSRMEKYHKAYVLLGEAKNRFQAALTQNSRAM